MPQVPIRRTFVPGAIAAILTIATEPSTARAQDQTPPCPEYTIEGTIDPPSSAVGESERTASVYVHAGEEPISSRQVIATFSDPSGTPIGEPSILVTDADGRARVAVPPSADSVNFVSETPDVPGCPSSVGLDPRVLLEIVPVTDPMEGGPGVDVPEEALAKTGPVSDIVALASLLLLAFGAAVGTGRGRRRSLAGAAHGAKRGRRG